ncbi:ADAT1 family protein [Megaselia abdita]
MKIMCPIADEVCKLAIEKFKSLPKTGKPTEKEWTILSAVIIHNKNTNKSKVVSIGTGTRSLPSLKYCELGLIVNDSHAEVIAKRSFQRYIYSELRKNDSIFKFNKETKTFDLQEDFSFHFYTSHIPCGDACIVERGEEKVMDKSEPKPKRKKVEEMFTGAKLLSDSVDKMSQDVGALRLKPGKGEQTLSMSCSDKLAKWNVLGVQGSLLSSLLSKPVVFESLNLSCDFDEQAVKRAVWKRFGFEDISERFPAGKPRIQRGEGVSFDFSYDKEKNACPNTISWADVEDRPLQVSVNGKRLGVGKKQFYDKKSSLDICKRLFMENYVDLVSSKDSLLDKFALTKESLSKMSYKEVKDLSKDYQKALQVLKTKYFKKWTEKNSRLKNFNITSQHGEDEQIESKMSMNWTNLPSHIFENIFQYSNLSELKNLSLVCKNWYEEIGDSWSEKYTLKCCIFDSEEERTILPKSCRQYPSVSICNNHINSCKSILSILKGRNLRKPCKILKMTINGVFYTANTPLGKVIDILNEYGGNLTTVKLSGLNDEQIDDSCNLILERLPNVRHFELQGLLELSKKNLEVLYGGFEKLRTLKLHLNRLSGFNYKFQSIQNLFLRNMEHLENLIIELEVDNYSSDLYLEPMKHLKHLKNLRITFSDRSHKKLGIDVLKHNKNLNTLHFKCCYISNEDLLKISTYFPELQNLKLCLDNNVEESSLRAIGEIQKLSTVELAFDGKFPNYFENWFNHCNKNFKSLNLIGSRKFHDYFVSKSLKDRVDYAKFNPLCIDNILKNLTQLEHLSITLASLKLENPCNLIFSNLKTLNFEDCNSKDSTHDFFSRLKSPKLTFLKTDILGMTDETVDVVLRNFPKLRDLHLTSEDKLSIRAMTSLNKANLESLFCCNLTIAMGKELLKDSKYLKLAKLKFNLPQMDVEQRLKFEKENKDVFMTVNAFDHKKAHMLLNEICQVFSPPLEKSPDQGWVVGSHCYRTYKLFRIGLNLEVAMKFNHFLDS